ncbi:MAG: adenosylcobalamin-dependent ribonucleoside-diphosphate reductase [Peptococcaceae bacterium]|nr:adenosylcobalamin-dependent ribonucleoside-diphosphate reductase [Peptococcaceae bacterium]
MGQLTPAGQKVFDARYAAKDEKGRICETFTEAVRRLAHTAAGAEKDDQKIWEEKFSRVLGELLFIPSTPIWANMGKTDRPWQPGACFVLEVEDTLESMYNTLKDTALVFKSGGGVGYNFSSIRPRGDLVASTKGQASGVVELLRLYDASAGMVKQGGVRRGAIIGILDIDHPEVIDFIEAKKGGGLTNFNLSVGVTDRFMEALDKDSSWQLSFKGEVRQELPACRLWQMIIEAAHSCGDPGVIFLDRLQEGNPVPGNRINATNPCGEQPLSVGESCLLGSINLDRMISKESGRLDEGLLVETVTVAVRFLDNMIDVADYPLPAIAAATRATRKIGLGFTGLADALIKAGLAYDSAEGREMAGNITKLIRRTAHAASAQLAEEKGCFPLWDQSVFYPNAKRRNAACITIAPTGSVTTMAGCEGYGVEPIFAVAYTKSTNVAGELAVFSPLFMAYIKDYNLPAETLAAIAEKGSCQGMDEIPMGLAKIFKGAQEITPAAHLLMQAVVQKHVDNAVSKTINLPEGATAEDIGTCYKTAFDLGLKGVTVFRDGSKKGTITVGGEAVGPAKALQRGEILPRPISAQGMTHRLDTGCGKIYLTINYQPESGKILETFITTGSDGGCLVYTEAASRLISLAIRGGISVEEITEQLEGTHSCPSYMLARGQGKKVSPGKSCASAIAKKLNEVREELDRRCGGEGNHKKGAFRGDVCEVCGQATLERAEGCMVCKNCGAARC